MAGFGVVVAFLMYGFVLSVIALFTSIFLYGKARYLYPEKSWAVHRFRVERAATPFVCLLWIIVALVLYTFISNKVAHQSVSFSPDPYVTLPNGYVVGSLNTYSGYVHAPGFNTDVPWTGPGYVRGIIDLEYADRRFQGTYLDSHSDMQPQGTDRIRRFVFDTRDRSIQTSDSSINADFMQQQTMVHEYSNSYWQLYAANRHHWPEMAFWLLLLAGEAVIIACAVRMRPELPVDERHSA